MEGSQDTRWDSWAAFYDTFHAARSPQSVVAFLDPWLTDSGVLELGVGTGRIALEIARKGMEVTGIDISPAMLDELEKKRGDLPLRTICGDMSDVAVNTQFGLIFCVFSSFYGILTQDDQVRCFRNVARALRPGGRFVLECFNPLSGGLLVDRQQLGIRGLGRGYLEISATINDPTTQRVDFQEVRFDESGLRLLPVSIRYAWPAELDLMARLAGLELKERYASVERDPYGPQSRGHVSVYGVK